MRAMAIVVVVALGGLLAGACAVPVEEAEIVEDQVEAGLVTDGAERAPRGLACRRTCEDRHAEEMRDCAKHPAGFLRRGCEDRARWMYRMCLKFCQEGAREWLDDGESRPMSP